jgi:hypothetical protein
MPSYKTLEAAAKKLGTANGYVGKTGGWIFKNGRSVMQGWWSMGNFWMGRGLISGNHADGYSINETTAAEYFAARA